MKWFAGCDNINVLRSEYKKLLIKYHPDNNKEDTTKAMQEINAGKYLPFTNGSIAM